MSEKQQLRIKYKALRDTLAKSEIESMSARIAENLFTLPAFGQPGAVMCYSSFGSEVATHKLMRKLLQQGRTVALPVTQQRTNVMCAVQIHSLESLTRGSFGIFEPSSNTKALPPNSIGVVLLPGLVFGRDGYRIGYGKGYYDKFLTSCPSAKRIALAYDLQVQERIPHESHDLAAHYIVTPKEVICCE